MLDRKARNRSTGESLREYGRGIAGGLLFSLPLLLTEEVWQLGSTADPARLLLALLGAFALLVGYNAFSGLHPDATWAEVLIDSVEEYGLGMALAALILFLVGRITPQMPFSEIVGRLVLESLLVAIGVSVGTAQLGGSTEDEEAPNGPGNGQQGGQPSAVKRSGLAAQIALGALGAFLLGITVSPTIEVLITGATAGGGKVLGICLFSLLLTALIQFFLNFIRSRPLGKHKSRITQVVQGTSISYAVALLVSAAVLWLFGRFDGAALSVALNQIVIVGLPAALGASAGRLLLSTGQGEEGQ